MGELRSIRAPASKSLVDRAKEEWLALSFLGGLIVTGFALHSWLAEQIAAIAGPSLAPRVTLLEQGQQVLQVNYEHLHEEVRATREDLRAFAAGRPLVALTPEPPPTPLPLPTVAPISTATHP